MKREDVTKIFESATDEQINALLNINSADIGNAKKKPEVAQLDIYSKKDNTMYGLLETEIASISVVN